MTTGLLVGVVCATLAFTLQLGMYVNPIRGVMPATTLRSTVRRSAAAARALDAGAPTILCIQFQGHMFFGNVTKVREKKEKTLFVRIRMIIIINKIIRIVNIMTIVRIIGRSGDEGGVACVSGATTAGPSLGLHSRHQHRQQCSRHRVQDLQRHAQARSSALFCQVTPC
jgi:MFS superfamily sulfate permease-like transporter